MAVVELEDTTMEEFSSLRRRRYGITWNRRTGGEREKGMERRRERERVRERERERELDGGYVK